MPLSVVKEESCGYVCSVSVLFVCGSSSGKKCVGIFSCFSFFEILSKADPACLIALVPKYINLARLVKDKNRLRKLLKNAAKRDFGDKNWDVFEHDDWWKLFNSFASNDILNAENLSPEDLLDVAFTHG